MLTQELPALDGDMIRLEAARFRRGSDVFGNERPTREISVSPYWIDRYPVVNAQFAHFIEDRGYETRALWTDMGWEFITSHGIRAPNYWTHSKWNGPNQPVTGISWWEAMAYARFVGKTLPTEAQWEYAAGFGARTYPWGEDEPTEAHANFAPGCEPAELDRRSMPVDHYALNVAASGCRDMAGNVGEWCLDNASPSYAWDDTGIDPLLVTAESDPHVLRGGSGLHDEEALRCASRDYYTPALRDNITGLRCVRNET